MSVKDLQNEIQNLKEEVQFQKEMAEMYKRRLEECERYARPFKEQETQKAREAINKIREDPEGKALLNALFFPQNKKRKSRKSRRV